jgi:DNA invertase Pin-like site-specific DNA recombinase
MAKPFTPSRLFQYSRPALNEEPPGSSELRRPHLMGLLRDIRAGLADVIVVEAFDRTAGATVDFKSDTD